MPAPDETILAILEKHKLKPKRRDSGSEIDPLAATAELAAIYDLAWIDVNACASADIERYKKKHSFKVSLDEEENLEFDFKSLVVLDDGKQRVWAFRGEMRKQQIRKRMNLVKKKDLEHHRAAQLELAYWQNELKKL